ncbi:TIGR03943 family putative permease subunit [Paenibacillus sacheonensis]|uniref:TIGR03943 family protein n=1 Tax=Paenibacillus sacheonensis TaxID=742054 RepID=A0A7X4YKU4_9BACL|nr:TIGR03943 family protein [Paenibacillus sacheonensis]MBM7563211.1 putative membrane protein [Paenibacillus sacheonensis]NBC68227.1 TIGR03943 family protein [Paenibacillus sacheonensis]
MIRLYVLAGFGCLFLMMNLNGNLNKYINTKYAYLSESAIVLLAILFVFEFVRLYAKEKEAAKRKAAQAAAERMNAEGGAHGEPEDELGHAPNNSHDHGHEHGHHRHNGHDHHGHDHYHDIAGHGREGHSHHGHSHEQPVRWKRYLGYGILIFPLLTGFILPVQTLDSSFVKAKGFSFPDFNVSADNPGFHQFLKPDTSVFYGKQGYAKVSKKELSEFESAKDVRLTDANFLKGLEALYNYPDAFLGRTLSFDGFIYKGEQAKGNSYFVFRFGFIHCVADSGVFGMLVTFPEGQSFENDQWVHVTGKLGSEFYQPFKQTLPVLEVKEWTGIPKPKDPYVYRA